MHAIAEGVGEPPGDALDPAGGEAPDFGETDCVDDVALAAEPDITKLELDGGDVAKVINYLGK